MRIQCSNDFAAVLAPIHQSLEEDKSQPGEIMREDRAVVNEDCDVPVTLYDIGAVWECRREMTGRSLPPVFFFRGVLCGACLVLEKKRWRERFVTVSHQAIAVYGDAQAWKGLAPPRSYQTLSVTTVCYIYLSVA